ncbi:MAG TPA: NAD(P)/FAD-dependent oxidoreductase [Candidatus Angelobacter sp.]|nr:NAD(P)/FAD-dependent oxidoreductase [Candidatus Angelobacter sp.]
MEAAAYDLIIAGAGPAGSACAITAARAGARVLLLEKDRFPRQRVCGEFVSSESLGLLEGLLGSGRLDVHAPVDSARIFIDGKCLTLPVRPAAQSVPRFELDARLFDSARRAGVVAREETAVHAVRREHELFCIETSVGAFTARAVVNATGRWSKLTQFEVTAKEKWLGLKAHFTESSPPSSVDLYFFPGGYCGVTPVDGQTVNACAMVQANVARSLEEVLARSPELHHRSAGWKPLFPAVSTSPLYFREAETESGGMLLAGDSAAFIDPFAGDGISLALQSGTLAAEVLAPFIAEKCSLAQAHQHYREAYKKRFSPAFRNAARLRSAFNAPKWIRTATLAFAGIPGIGRMLIQGTRAR